MTLEQQRIALAEWDGYTRLIGDPWKSMGVLAFIPPGMSIVTFIKVGEPAVYLEELPDYLNDLNAVHELEEKLNDEEHLWFRMKLWDVVIESTNEDRWDRSFISATAAQRCEALLKTLNLWKP